MDIIVRCEFDAVLDNKGEQQLISIKALNEHDARSQVRTCSCVYFYAGAMHMHVIFGEGDCVRSCLDRCQIEQQLINHASLSVLSNHSTCADV